MADHQARPYTVQELHEMTKEQWLEEIDSQDVDEDARRPPPKVEWTKK